LTFFNDLISKQQKVDSQVETEKKDEKASEISKIFDIGEYYFRKKQYNQALYCYVRYITYFPQGEYVKTATERISRIILMQKMQ
jgi:hypothetical protein